MNPRIAFTVIGGSGWMGGHNYLLNLFKAIAAHGNRRIEIVLLAGEDVPDSRLEPFIRTGVPEIRRDRCLDAARATRSLVNSLILGRDREFQGLLRRSGVNLVFEAASYRGWRLGIPALAWMPDFQHRMMPEFFTRAGWLRREASFQVQIRSGRYAMVSSDDSRAICEALYPGVRGKVRTVRFAVPPPRAFSAGEILALRARYGLPEKFFLMPNQYWAHKNHRTVIGALAILANRGVRPVVLASGNQDDPRNPHHFRMLEELVRREGLVDQFKMPGLIPVDDLHGLMAGCEAVINSSLFEGWSTTVEEARSAGVPLILSDIAVHREQAAQEGVFFRRLDAVDLADTLEAHISVEPAKRAARALRASADAQRRVKAFADDFIGLAYDCIG